MITSSNLTIDDSASTVAADDDDGNDNDNHNSSSTIATDKVSGSHVLTIAGYSKTKGIGVGVYLRSAAFVVGGHNWCIRYYPDGYRNFSDDHISFLLEPVDYEGDIHANFSFCLLDKFDVPVPTLPSFSNIFSSTAHKPSGYRFFYRRHELENSPYLMDNDTFRVRCDVVVTTIKIHASVPFLSEPSKDLHRNFGDLLESKVGADVTFIVGADEVFTAHRNVLAVRSPVFMAQFFGPLKEDVASPIRIDDMDASVFRAMLHFVYTDTLPEIGEGDRTLMAQHLLVAADRYNLERLKRNCEDVLGSYVDTDTVATTLVIAERHGCHVLKKVCLKFLRSQRCNANAGTETWDFDNLKSCCPSILQELLVNKLASCAP